MVILELFEMHSYYCVTWFQWIKGLKDQKKADKKKEMYKNVRRSPRSIDIKAFYKESSSSEEEKRRVKRSIVKLRSPPKKVLCRLIDPASPDRVPSSCFRNS